MKLTGKKMLAFLLAVAMTLSMSVTVFADETIAVTSVSIDSSMSIDVGEKEKLEATVRPSNATNKNVTWSSSDEAIATVDASGEVTGVKAGKATITVTTDDGGKTDTCEVTVKMNDDAKILEVKIADKDAAMDIPYNIDEDDVVKALKDVEVIVVYDQGDVKTDATWSSEDFTSATVGATMKFLPKLDRSFDVPDEVALPEITGTVVKAKLASESAVVDTIAAMLGTREADLELPEYVSVALDNNKSVNFGIGDYSNRRTENDLFDDWYSDDYNDDKIGTYTFTAKWLGGSDNYELQDLVLEVNVIDSDFALENVAYTGASLKDIAEAISDLLKGMYGEELDSIDFEHMEMDGGSLYIVDDDDNRSLVDEDYYDYDEFLNMVYYPNGSGEDSVIEYVAYTSDDDESVEGEIQLESDSFMLLDYEITTDDMIEFKAEDFEDALAEIDKDYELSYVTFDFTGSKTKGWLYYEYDEDDEEGEKINGRDKCWVEGEERDDIELDDVVYVPGSSMKAGTYVIEFTAEGKDGRKDVSEVGFVRITMTEEADLVVSAGRGESVAVNFDLFEDYLKDNVSSARKNYEVCYIQFTDAPVANSKGYLTVDGKKVSKIDTRAFYIEDDDDGDYALEDLYYLGGTDKATTRATFQIYGKQKSTSKSYTLLVEGTIDFVTGASNSLTGGIRASETMKFAANLQAIKALGDQDNKYVTFSALPVGGKLVYGWGTASQEDVKVGTKYYLTSTSGQKSLGNVTFIPSYSESKIQKTIPIYLKAYDAKDKAISATINLSVTYAAYSSKFSDITTNTYADSVDFLANQGITTGMTATTFGPNNKVTRAQFVTFLYRAAGQPAVYGVTNKFTDVKNTGTYAYAYNAILWAVQNGITTGRSETKFAPEAEVTHQELLTFLYRYDVQYLKHPGTTSSYVNFTDWASVQSWAQTAVKWAHYKQIVTGYTLQPAVSGTRATVALWLHRMLTL